MLDRLYHKLETYKKAFEKFEREDREKLYSFNPESNDEQLELLRNLHEIINALNGFNSDLLVYHPIISKNIILREYSKFYNNLVMSKMKYFFFREEPKKSLSDVDENLIEEIYKIAKKITVLRDENQLKGTLANYYFFIFLLFDFLFTKDKTILIGYFTKFKTDKNRFIQIKDFILKQMNQVKDEESFRNFSDEIIGHVINNYIGKDKNEQVSIKSISDIRIVYKKFIELRRKNEKIYIEPFSYFIAYEMWKYGKLLHRLPDVDDIVAGRVEEHKKHLKLYFEIIEDAYNSGKIDYNKIFDFQYRFINDVNKFIKFDDIDRLSLPKKAKYSISLKKLQTPKNRKKRVNFHIDKMLAGYNDALSLTKLNYLLITLFSKIKTDENTALFGIYSSGAFLAHMYNFFNATNKEIILFKTFPFIDFQPVYAREDIVKHDNFIIFDDTIRTGFTFTLLKNAFFRTVKKELKKYTLAVVAKNRFLDELYLDYNMKFISSHYYDEIQLFDYEVDVDFEQFVYEDVSLIIKDIVGDINNKIDYTLFLADTRLAFSIAYSMVKKIINLYELKNSNKKIDLFFTSSASKTLVLLVAYILRHKGYDVVMDSVKKHHFKVAIDLTIKTKHTLKHSMAFIRDIDIKDLDLICVIHNYGKKNKKIYEVING